MIWTPPDWRQLDLSASSSPFRVPQWLMRETLQQLARTPFGREVCRVVLTDPPDEVAASPLVGQTVTVRLPKRYAING